MYGILFNAALKCTRDDSDYADEFHLHLFHLVGLNDYVLCIS